MRAFIFSTILMFTAACSGETASSAAQERAVAVRVENAWAAPTPGGVEVSAGYVTIVNSGASDDRLVSITTPRAERAEVHEMSMDGGVMRMRALEGGLVIPAGGRVTLGPGGQHLMFYGVTQPFTEGETIPVTLTFEHAGALRAELPVRRAAPSHAH